MNLPSKYTFKRFSALLAVLLVFSVLFFPGTVAYGGVIQQSDSFYVADTANVLSADTESYIVEKNASLESLCGGQIVVATVDFLDGMDIEDYAYKLFADWDIGDSDENNGILLLLAIGEDNYWCMQGKGLESKLTSGDIDDILWNNLEEDFAAGDYDAGVRSTFDALYTQVSAIYGGASGSSSSSTGGGSSQGGYSNGYGNGYSDGYESGQSGYGGYGSGQGGHSNDFFFTMIGFCVVVFIVLLVLLLIVVMVKKRRRPDFYDSEFSAPPRRHGRRRTVFIPPAAPRPRPPRPPQPSGPPRSNPSGFGGSASRNHSGSSLFGGGGSASRGSSGAGRSSSSRSGGGLSRSSSSSSRVGGGLGRGGGGVSRGGGAGRRH